MREKEQIKTFYTVDKKQHRCYNMFKAGVYR